MSSLDLGVVDVPTFLSGLGIHHTIESHEARFSCPYPAHPFGDKNPSAYMNLDTTAWICFACGEKGNAITMLADVMEVSRLEAKNWIAEKWAPHYANIEDLHGFLLRLFAEDRSTQDAVEHVPVVLPEDVLIGRSVDWRAVADAGAEAPESLRYLLDRGLTPETLDRFGAIYDQISDRPCIQVRDENGHLAGFKGRAWNDGQWPKYMVIGDTDRSVERFGQRYGFKPYDASQIVFALDLAEPIDDTFIVCEGELNVMTMHQMGFTNTIGPSGSTFSPRFVDLVVERCSTIILLLDSDLSDPVKAATARVKVFKALSMFEPFIKVCVCEDHDGDPNDMERDQIQTLIETAIPSTLYRVQHLLLA